MLDKPNIVLSALDVERIEKLLDNTVGLDEKIEDNLLSELERGDIVDAQDVPGNVVTMNSTVRFSVSSSQEDFRLTLVYPKDMTDDGTTISILAPVGSAMLGLKEGDKIEWPNASGNAMQVRIEEVVYQPDRAGEYHR